MNARDDARARRDAARAVADARRRLASTPLPKVTVPPLPSVKAPALPALPSVKAPALPALPQMPQMPQMPPALSAQIDAAKTAQRQQARHRRVVAVLIAVIVALLLAQLRCDEEPAPVPPAALALTCPEAPVCGEAKKPVKKKRPPPKTPPPATGRTVEQPRDVLAVPQLRTPPWLASLRLQVSARSLALAQCFNGTEKPGALRLTATVTPKSGLLTDAELEALSQSGALDAGQDRCVLGVLQSPPYRLADGAGVADDVGTRISLILEF